MTPEQYETKIKELEEALRESEERWQGIRGDVQSYLDNIEKFVWDIKRIL